MMLGSNIPRIASALALAAMLVAGKGETRAAAGPQAEPIAAAQPTAVASAAANMTRAVAGAASAASSAASSAATHADAFAAVSLPADYRLRFPEFGSAALTLDPPPVRTLAPADVPVPREQALVPLPPAALTGLVGLAALGLCGCRKTIVRFMS